MASPDDLPAGAPPPAAAPTAFGALVETTLHDAHIAVLAPTRLVLVGAGLRLRIDHRGVRRQSLSEVRLALPMPDGALTDPDLQHTLASWAGDATNLHAHELVRSGDRFARTLHLTDVGGRQVTLDNAVGLQP